MEHNGREIKLKKRPKKYNLVKSIVLHVPHHARFSKIDQFLWCLNNISRKQTLKDFKNYNLEVAGLKFKNPNFALSSSSKLSYQKILKSPVDALPTPKSISEAVLNTQKPHTPVLKIETGNNELAHVEELQSLVEPEDSKVRQDPAHENSEKKFPKQLDFRLTENTSFYFIEDKYKLVIAIDVSKSLFALDTEAGRPVIDSSMKTLIKCLRGIVQPFTLESDLAKSYTWEPSIFVSVIAFYGSLNIIQQKVYDEYVSGKHESSKSRSSQPGVRENNKFPSFCTLVHSEYIRSRSMSSLIDTIFKNMCDYIQEIKDLTKAIDDCLEKLLLTSESRLFLDSLNQAGGNKADSLVECLEISKHTLELLPTASSAGFIFITDGVLDSGVNAASLHTTTSWFVESSVNSTIIQVGANSGFNPTVTFGNVADNELLRFVAVALQGAFYYSSDCPDIIPYNQVNFYHDNLILKRLILNEGIYKDHMQAVHTGLPRLSDIPREWLNKHPERPQRNLNNLATPFPWEEQSFSPVVETLEARYREYQLPIGLGLIMQARIKEGFILTDLRVTPLDPKMFVDSPKDQPNSKSNRSGGVCEQIRITFKLPWMPNVTIFYQVSSIHISGDTVGFGSKKLPYSLRSSIPRSQSFQNYVKINIRSYKLFTLLFLESSHEDSRSNSVAKKARSLHVFLKNLTEKDQKLKVLYTPNPKPCFFSSNRSKNFSSTGASSSAGAIPPKLDDQEKYIYKLLSSWVEQDENCLSQLAGFECVDTIFLSNFFIESSIKNLGFRDLKNIGKDLLNEFISEYFLSSHPPKPELTEQHQGSHSPFNFENLGSSSDAGAVSNSENLFSTNKFAPLGDKNLRTSICFLNKKWSRYQGSQAFVVVKWEFVTDWIIKTTLRLFNGNRESQEMLLRSIFTFIESFYTKAVIEKRPTGVSQTESSRHLPLNHSNENKDPISSQTHSDKQFNSAVSDSQFHPFESLPFTAPSEIQADELSSLSAINLAFDSDAFLPLFRADRPIHLLLTPECFSDQPFDCLRAPNSSLASFSACSSSHVKKYEWEWEYVPVSSGVKNPSSMSDTISFLSPEDKMEIFQTLYRVAGEICHNRLLNCYMLLSISNGALKVLSKHGFSKGAKGYGSLPSWNTDTQIDYTNPDDCFKVAFYNEINSDDEVLILQSCIYIVEVDLNRLCIRTEIWVEPFFQSFLTSIFEEDSTLMVPIASFQKILMPNRKFERVSRKVSFNSNNSSLFAPVSMLTKSRYQLRLLEIPSFHSPNQITAQISEKCKSLAKSSPLEVKRMSNLPGPLSVKHDTKPLTLNHTILNPWPAGSNLHLRNVHGFSSSDISLASLKPPKTQKLSHVHQTSLAGLNHLHEKSELPLLQNLRSNSIGAKETPERRLVANPTASSENKIDSSQFVASSASSFLAKKAIASGTPIHSNNPSNNSLSSLPESAILDLSLSKGECVFALPANNKDASENSQPQIGGPLYSHSQVPSTSGEKMCSSGIDSRLTQPTTAHEPNSETSTYILEKSILLDLSNLNASYYTISSNIIGYLKKELNPLVLRYIDSSRKANSAIRGKKEENKEYLNFKSMIDRNLKARIDATDLFTNPMFNIRNAKEISSLLFRLFLEYALFEYCDAIVVLNVNFNKLKFTGKVMQQLLKIDPLLKLSTLSPTSNTNNPLQDKWYVKRLSNKESFLFITFPNITTTTGNQAFNIQPHLARNSKNSDVKPESSLNSYMQKNSPNNAVNSVKTGISSDNTSNSKVLNLAPEINKSDNKAHIADENQVKWLLGSESEAASMESYNGENIFSYSQDEPSIFSTQKSDAESSFEPPGLQHLQSYTLAFECSIASEEYRRRNISANGSNHGLNFGVDFSMEVIDVPFSGGPKYTSSQVYPDLNSQPHLKDSTPKPNEKHDKPNEKHDKPLNAQFGYAFCGCTSKAKSIPLFTPEAIQELEFIEKLYNTATAQSVYLALLLGYKISSSNFSIESIPRYIDSNMLQFDLTEYLHTLDISRANLSANNPYLYESYKKSESKALHDSVVSILSKNFAGLVYEDDRFKSSTSIEGSERLKAPICGNFNFCNPRESSSWSNEQLIDFALFPIYIKIKYKLEFDNVKSSKEHSKSACGDNEPPTGPIYVNSGHLPSSIAEALKAANVKYNPYGSKFLQKPNVRVILCIECFYPQTQSAKPVPRHKNPETTSLDSLNTTDNFRALNQSILKAFPKTHFEIFSELCTNLELYFMRETLFYLHNSITKTEPVLNKAWSIISRSLQIFTRRGDNSADEFCVNNVNLHFKEVLRYINQMYNRKSPKSISRNSDSDLASSSNDNSSPNNLSNLSSSLNVDNTLILFIDMLCKQNKYPGKLNKVGDTLFLEISNPENNTSNYKRKPFECESTPDRKFVDGFLQDSYKNRSFASVNSSNFKASLGTVSNDLLNTDIITSSHINSSDLESKRNNKIWVLIRIDQKNMKLQILSHCYVYNKYSQSTAMLHKKVLEKTTSQVVSALKDTTTQLLLEQLLYTHCSSDILIEPQFGLERCFEDSSMDANLAVFSPELSNRAKHSKIEFGRGAGEYYKIDNGIIMAPMLKRNAKAYNYDPDLDIVSLLNGYIVTSTGYYKCPEQVFAAFPIHSKISSSKILQSICSSELGNSKIENRDNMYVIKQDESIFYLKFTTQELPTFGSLDRSDKLISQSQNPSSRCSSNNGYNFTNKGDRLSNLNLKNRTNVTVFSEHDGSSDIIPPTPKFPASQFVGDSLLDSNTTRLYIGSPKTPDPLDNHATGRPSPDQIKRQGYKNYHSLGLPRDSTSLPDKYTRQTVKTVFKKYGNIDDNVNLTDPSNTRSLASSRSISSSKFKEATIVSPRAASFFGSSLKMSETKISSITPALDIHDGFRPLSVLHEDSSISKSVGQYRSSNSTPLTKPNNVSPLFPYSSLRTSSAIQDKPNKAPEHVMNTTSSRTQTSLVKRNYADPTNPLLLALQLPLHIDGASLSQHHSNPGLGKNSTLIVSNSSSNNQNIFSLEGISNENSNCASNSSSATPGTGSEKHALNTSIEPIKSDFNKNSSYKNFPNGRRHSEVYFVQNDIQPTNTDKHIFSNPSGSALQSRQPSTSLLTDSSHSMSKAQPSYGVVDMPHHSVGRFDANSKYRISDPQLEDSGRKALSSHESPNRLPPKMVKTQSFSNSSQNAYKPSDSQTRFYLVLQIFGLKAPPKNMINDTINYIFDYIKTDIVMPELTLHIDRNSRLIKDDFNFIFDKSNCPITFYLPVLDFENASFDRPDSVPLQPSKRTGSLGESKSSVYSNVSSGEVQTPTKPIHTKSNANLSGTSSKGDTFGSDISTQLLSTYLRNNISEIIPPFMDCYSNATSEVFEQSLRASLVPCLEDQVPVNQFNSMFGNTLADFFKPKNQNSADLGSSPNLICTENRKHKPNEDLFKISNLQNGQVYVDDPKLLASLGFLYHCHPHLKSNKDTLDFGRGIASIQVSYVKRKFTLETRNLDSDDDFAEQFLDSLLFRKSDKNYSLKLQVLSSFIKRFKEQIQENCKEQYDSYSSSYDYCPNARCDAYNSKFGNSAPILESQTLPSSPSNLSTKFIRFVAFTMWPIGNIKVEYLINKLVDTYMRTVCELLMETVVVPKLISTNSGNSAIISKEESDIYELIAFIGNQNIPSIPMSQHNFVKISKSVKTFAHAVLDLVNNASPSFKTSMAERINTDGFDYRPNLPLFNSTNQHEKDNLSIDGTNNNIVPINKPKASAIAARDSVLGKIPIANTQNLERSVRRSKLLEITGGKPVVKNEISQKAANFIKDSGKIFFILSYFYTGGLSKNTTNDDYCDWADVYSSEDSELHSTIKNSSMPLGFAKNPQNSLKSTGSDLDLQFSNQLPRKPISSIKSSNARISERKRMLDLLSKSSYTSKNSFKSHNLTRSNKSSIYDDSSRRPKLWLEGKIKPSSQELTIDTSPEKSTHSINSDKPAKFGVDFFKTKAFKTSHKLYKKIFSLTAKKLKLSSNIESKLAKGTTEEASSLDLFQEMVYLNATKYRNNSAGLYKNSMLNPLISVKKIKKYAATSVSYRKSRYPYLEIRGLKRFDPKISYGLKFKALAHYKALRKPRSSLLTKHAPSSARLFEDKNSNTLLRKTAEISPKSNYCLLFVKVVNNGVYVAGYNIKQDFWDLIRTSIDKQIENEINRFDLLQLSIFHEVGMFECARKMQKKLFGLETHSSDANLSWIELNLSRDMVNHYDSSWRIKLGNQVPYIQNALDPNLYKVYQLLVKICAENIEGKLQLEPKYESSLGLLGSKSLRNDIVSSGLPGYLKWTRELMYVDFTQPYVESNHKDFLFATASRFFRSYDSRLKLLLWENKLRFIINKWNNLYDHQMLVQNKLWGLPKTGNYSNAKGQASSLGNKAINTSSHGSRIRPASGLSFGQTEPASATRNTSHYYSLETSSNGNKPSHIHLGIGRNKQPLVNGSEDSSDANNIRLEDLDDLLLNSRILHSVCADIPLIDSLQPSTYTVSSLRRYISTISQLFKTIIDNYTLYLKSLGIHYILLAPRKVPALDALKLLSIPELVIKKLMNGTLPWGPDFTFLKTNSNNASAAPTKDFKKHKNSTRFTENTEGISNTNNTRNHLPKKTISENPITRISNLYKTNNSNLSPGIKTDSELSDSYSFITVEDNIDPVECSSSSPSSQVKHLGDLTIYSSFLSIRTEIIFLILDVSVGPSTTMVKMNTIFNHLDKYSTTVPGYVKTPYSYNFLKKITYEVSKLKKLLHIKSFTYDVQLRIVTELLVNFPQPLSKVCNNLSGSKYPSAESDSENLLTRSFMEAKRSKLATDKPINTRYSTKNSRGKHSSSLNGNRLSPVNDNAFISSSYNSVAFSEKSYRNKSFHSKSINCNKKSKSKQPSVSRLHLPFNPHKPSVVEKDLNLQNGKFVDTTKKTKWKLNWAQVLGLRINLAKLINVLSKQPMYSIKYSGYKLVCTSSNISELPALNSSFGNNVAQYTDYKPREETLKDIHNFSSGQSGISYSRKDNGPKDSGAFVDKFNTPFLVGLVDYFLSTGNKYGFLNNGLQSSSCELRYKTSFETIGNYSESMSSAIDKHSFVSPHSNRISNKFLKSNIVLEGGSLAQVKLFAVQCKCYFCSNQEFEKNTLLDASISIPASRNTLNQDHFGDSSHHGVDNDDDTSLLPSLFNKPSLDCFVILNTRPFAPKINDSNSSHVHEENKNEHNLNSYQNKSLRIPKSHISDRMAGCLSPGAELKDSEKDLDNFSLSQKTKLNEDEVDRALASIGYQVDTSESALLPIDMSDWFSKGREWAGSSMQLLDLEDAVYSDTGASMGFISWVKDELDSTFSRVQSSYFSDYFWNTMINSLSVKSSHTTSLDTTRLSDSSCTEILSFLETDPSISLFSEFSGTYNRVGNLRFCSQDILNSIIHINEAYYPQDGHFKRLGHTKNMRSNGYHSRSYPKSNNLENTAVKLDDPPSTSSNNHGLSFINDFFTDKDDRDEKEILCCPQEKGDKYLVSSVINQNKEMAGSQSQLFYSKVMQPLDFSSLHSSIKDNQNNSRLTQSHKTSSLPLNKNIGYKKHSKRSLKLKTSKILLKPKITHKDFTSKDKHKLESYLSLLKSYESLGPFVCSTHSRALQKTRKRAPEYQNFGKNVLANSSNISLPWNEILSSSFVNNEYIDDNFKQLDFSLEGSSEGGLVSYADKHKQEKTSKHPDYSYNASALVSPDDHSTSGLTSRRRNTISYQNDQKDYKVGDSVCNVTAGSFQPAQYPGFPGIKHISILEGPKQGENIPIESKNSFYNSSFKTSEDINLTGGSVDVQGLGDLHVPSELKSIAQSNAQDFLSDTDLGPGGFRKSNYSGQSILINTEMNKKRADQSLLVDNKISKLFEPKTFNITDSGVLFAKFREDVCSLQKSEYTQKASSNNYSSYSECTRLSEFTDRQKKNFISDGKKSSSNQLQHFDALVKSWLLTRAKLSKWFCCSNITRLILVNPFNSNYVTIIWLYRLPNAPTSRNSNCAADPTRDLSEPSSLNKDACNDFSYYRLCNDKNLSYEQTVLKLNLKQLKTLLNCNHQNGYDKIKIKKPAFAAISDFESDRLLSELADAKNDPTFISDSEIEVEAGINTNKSRSIPNCKNSASFNLEQKTPSKGEINVNSFIATDYDRYKSPSLSSKSSLNKASIEFGKGSLTKSPNSVVIMKMSPPASIKSYTLNLSTANRPIQEVNTETVLYQNRSVIRDKTTDFNHSSDFLVNRVGSFDIPPNNSNILSGKKSFLGLNPHLEKDPVYNLANSSELSRGLFSSHGIYDSTAAKPGHIVNPESNILKPGNTASNKDEMNGNTPTHQTPLNEEKSAMSHPDFSNWVILDIGSVAKTRSQSILDQAEREHLNLILSIFAAGSLLGRLPE